MSENQIQFICPKCKSDKLSIMERGLYSSEIEYIYPDGDCDFACREVLFEDETEIINFYCQDCGYVLRNEDGEQITTYKDMVKFCKKQMNDNAYILHRYIDDNV